MHGFRRVAEGVLVATEPITVVGPEHVAFVKEEARRAAKRRARLCLHRQDGDRLHEMVIALDRETYVRPHLHDDKSETFHVIEGRADVAVFDEAGELERVIPLGGDGALLYRLDEPRFHTLVIRTDIFVIHEITNGPFVPGGSRYAAFAPAEDGPEGRAYLARLRERIEGTRS